VAPLIYMASLIASDSSYTQQPNITKKAQILPYLRRLSQISQNIATIAKPSQPSL
ncbi:hypothetical protein L873DRAFT_1820839, partial [Choiromyces venosus 120613-1]